MKDELGSTTGESRRELFELLDLARSLPPLTITSDSEGRFQFPISIQTGLLEALGFAIYELAIQSTMQYLEHKRTFTMS